MKFLLSQFLNFSAFIFFHPPFQNYVFFCQIELSIVGRWLKAAPYPNFGRRLFFSGDVRAEKRAKRFPSHRAYIGCRPDTTVGPPHDTFTNACVSAPPLRRPYSVDVAPPWGAMGLRGQPRILLLKNKFVYAFLSHISFLRTNNFPRINFFQIVCFKKILHKFLLQ